jgi:hypothetical protein
MLRQLFEEGQRAQSPAKLRGAQRRIALSDRLIIEKQGEFQTRGMFIRAVTQ